jgi:hypothetical protein
MFDARSIAGEYSHGASHVQARWEGETLVSVELRSGVEVLERFTRIDTDTLAYELSVRNAATSGSVCAIRFLLTRVSVHGGG